MKHEFWLGIGATVIASGFLLSVGCGGSSGGSGGAGGSTITKSACEQAADDLLAIFEACPDYVPASTSGSSGTVTCTEADGKKAQCIVDCTAATSCECLGLDKSKMCSTDDSMKYTTCLSDCAK